jgi:hypothetical protein
MIEIKNQARKWPWMEMSKGEGWKFTRAAEVWRNNPIWEQGVYCGAATSLGFIVIIALHLYNL